MISQPKPIEPTASTSDGSLAAWGATIDQWRHSMEWGRNTLSNSPGRAGLPYLIGPSEGEAGRKKKGRGSSYSSNPLVAITGDGTGVLEIVRGNA